MSLALWAWLLPLPGLLLTAAGLPRGQRGAGWASLPGPFLLLAVALLALLGGQPSATLRVEGWLPFLPDGAFHLSADGLSALMLAIVGCVASAVYVYSLGYMADDPGRRRFFVYLDVFVAAMALLVLAGNLAVLLIGWTGVGLASFLLISFWRHRDDTLPAGLQALAANAIGDGALLLAAVLVPRGCGALAELGSPACARSVGGSAEVLAALIVVAAAAKSAQGPLYFWLPSAMAGPTPISALIHAATMVAAGVYLLARTHLLLEQAPTVLQAVAWLGVLTALAASLASLAQSNFKRGIAYSTVAQLGYMFAAVGVASSFSAMYHLTTHAFFKALLFLAAGVVIHGVGGEERLDRLSGQGRRFRVSHWGFLIGSLALIGTPFTAGGFSKDAVIEAGLAHQPLVGWLLLGGAALTGLYTGRLFFRVYHGPPAAPAAAAGHGDAQSHAHAHHDASAARLMDLPLLPLMAGSLLAGFLAWPVEWLQHAIPGTLQHPLAAQPDSGHVAPLSATGLLAFALGLGGFLAAGWWARRPVTVAPERAPAAGWAGWLGRGAYSAAGRLAALHTGSLPRYAFGSVLALALLLLARMVAP